MNDIMTSTKLVWVCMGHGMSFQFFSPTFAMFCAAFLRCSHFQLSRARRAQPTPEPLEIR